MNGSGTGRPRQRILVLAGALLACLAAIWHFARAGRDEPPAPAVVADDEAPAAPVAAAPPAEPRRAPEPAPAPARPLAPDPDQVISSDGLPIMPAHDGEPKTEGMHPHPITPQHLRIYAENRLVGALDGAMDDKNAAEMRKLLEQYRREYPEDNYQLQDGYALIADCLEHPGAASRAAAERWLDAHNGSGLKRFVNSNCIEPHP